jgi:FkbM family methyltransferase
MLRPNLILDVGMHDGQDTAFYLAKGFDVVAVEANPDLVAAAEQRFEDEIAAGRLRILGVAVAPERGTMPLAVADAMTIWSSLAPDFVARNEERENIVHRYVDVPTLPFADILEETGIPYYLKVDIEGYDMLCVEALEAFRDRPRYVSIESSVSANEAPAGPVLSELRTLHGLGYRGFKYVNQRRHPDTRLPDPPREGRYAEVTFTSDGSGPFGEESVGRWLPMPAALAQAQLLRVQHNLGGYGGRWRGTAIGRQYVRRVRRGGHSWYDLHARLR